MQHTMPPIGVDLGHMHDLLMFIGIMIIMLSFGMPAYNNHTTHWKITYIVVGLILILLAIAMRVTGN